LRAASPSHRSLTRPNLKSVLGLSAPTSICPSNAHHSLKTRLIAFHTCPQEHQHIHPSSLSSLGRRILRLSNETAKEILYGIKFALALHCHLASLACVCGPCHSRLGNVWSKPLSLSTREVPTSHILPSLTLNHRDSNKTSENSTISKTHISDSAKGMTCLGFIIQYKSLAQIPDPVNESTQLYRTDGTSRLHVFYFSFLLILPHGEVLFHPVQGARGVIRWAVLKASPSKRRLLSQSIPETVERYATASGLFRPQLVTRLVWWPS
jgi:hypothetical protein